MKKIPGIIRRIIIGIVVFIALSSILLLSLALTPVPFHIYYRLGAGESIQLARPDFIILLGGSGMPSESNLIRSYYTAILANDYSGAGIVISLPSDTSNPSCSAYQIRDELVMRGIAAGRIRYETSGRNTRSQALNLFEMLGGINPSVRVTVVTSPEHMTRAIKSLRKAGFKEPGGVPAFENPNDTQLDFNDDELGGKGKAVPKIGRKLGLRYNFWTQLHYERLIIREYLALTYYRLKGWI